MRHRPFPFLALVIEGAASALDGFQASALRTATVVTAVAASVCAALAAGAAARGVAVRVRHDLASDDGRGFMVYPWPGVVGTATPLGAADARALDSLPQIAAAAAHQAAAFPIAADRRVVPSVAVDAYDASGPMLAGAELLHGRWFTSAEHAGAAPVVVLEARLAAALLPPPHSLGARIEIAHRRFRVIGVVRDAGSGPRAIVPLETARRVLGLAPRWTDLAVRLRDHVVTSDAVRAAMARLRQERALTPGEPADFLVAGMDELRAGDRTVHEITGAAAASITVLGLLAAGVAVLVAMMLSVAERTREIGIRKVLGATRAAIRLQFMVEAATLGALGATVGIAGGRAIGMLVAGATPIPASVSRAAACIALGLTIAGGAAAGWPPASRAARLDALRALGGD